MRDRSATWQGGGGRGGGGGGEMSSLSPVKYVRGSFAVSTG